LQATEALAQSVLTGATFSGGKDAVDLLSGLADTVWDDDETAAARFQTALLIGEQRKQEAPPPPTAPPDSEERNG
jgi:hypothetical protein